METICVVAGATGTGKTELGIELALALGGEVISADSMQLYRRMDIGTAKPTTAEMRGVPHHMLSVIDPAESFSVYGYGAMARAAADDILSRGRLPIIVGGTGLYIDAILRGGDFSVPSDEGLRRSLADKYDDIGGEALLRELAKIDPGRAARLPPGDKRRIVRALEVYTLTGKTITRHDEESRLAKPPYNPAMIILGYRGRAELYAKIDARVDRMIAAGLLDEVRALTRELPAGCTAMQAIGYKELAAYLRGETALPDAIETIKRESRRYAKRQITWFARYTDALRLYRDETPDFSRVRQLSTAFVLQKI